MEQTHTVKGLVLGHEGREQCRAKRDSFQHTYIVLAPLLYACLGMMEFTVSIWLAACADRALHCVGVRAQLPR